VDPVYLVFILAMGIVGTAARWALQYIRDQSIPVTPIGALVEGAVGALAAILGVEGLPLLGFITFPEGTSTWFIAILIGFNSVDILENLFNRVKPPTE